MVLEDLPSVQDEEPKVRVPLRWVGFTELIIPAGRIVVDGLELMLMPEFSVFIDLPENMRGIHASRSYESIKEVVEKYIGRIVKLEDITGRSAESLLRLHPYASRSLVKPKARAIRELKAPLSSSRSYKPFMIHSRAFAKRAGDRIVVRRYIGVEAHGLTACPCVKEAAKAVYDERNVTHMQRGVGRLIVEVFEGLEIDVLNLLDILLLSMSAPSIPNLKRADEVEVVMNAVKSAKFAEDCVRGMAMMVVKRWPKLPDKARIEAKVKSMESIHHQNLLAYLRTTAGAVRKALSQEG